MKSGNSSVTFNRHNGWIDYLDINNLPILEQGYQIKPDFWRAPTDNDCGAGFDHQLRAWENPGYELKSFICDTIESNIRVVAEYDLKNVDSKLRMAYTMTPKGELKIEEKLTVNPEAKQKPMIPRFGLQLVMREPYNTINYYGRGPVENYCDRKNSQNVGIYTQSVSQQYWQYIRPQESGNKTDVRWWKLLDKNNTGLLFYAPNAMECSAIQYLISDLDCSRYSNTHSGDLTPRQFSVVHLQSKQMGLGCINSWGAWPSEQYRIPYSDQEFTVTISPLY